MTRGVDLRTLVEAFSLPGSAAEATFRELLERRIATTVGPVVVTQLSRLLVDELGWVPPLAAEAVAQVERLAGK